MNSFIPIIICGGSGTRLWPLSNEKKPKQFIKLFNNKSLFEHTLERCIKINKNNLIIVASKENRKNIEKLLINYNAQVNIIYEEIGRNTAAAVFFGLKEAEKINPKSSVIIMPSDHYIADYKKFNKSILNFKTSLSTFNWLLLGIKPTSPSTGFGYIKSIGKSDIRVVEKFIEKPEEKKAKTLIKDPNVFWNSGIFLGKTKSLLQSIKDYDLSIYSKSKIAWEKKRKLEEHIFILENKYLEQIDDVSIDIAVIEKEKKIAVAPLDIQWSDVGSWDALAQLEVKLDINNKNKNLFEVNSRGNFIISDKQVSLIGVENMIIVSHKNNLLIINKGESEKIKEIFKKIKK